MELIEQIGAYLGVASFLGLAALALLYFSQARDVRRLRDWAGRAPERAAEAVQQAAQTYATQAEPIRRERLRRQRRERGMPEARYLALIVGGVVIIGIGVAVFAAQQLGGEEGSETAVIEGGSSRGKGGKPIAPGAVTVAVLNGTDVPGLAAKVGDDIEANGFKLGPVTNSDSPYELTTAMYDRGHLREAEAVAKALGVKKVRLIAAEIRPLIGNANVVVIVGGDRTEV